MISEKTLKNWCSALGLYREHAGALRSTDEPEAFDAMGVLLQLVDPDGWHLVSMSWQHTLARGSHYVSTDLIPHDVQAELARLTDVEHMDHEYIAGYLRCTMPARIQRHERELEQAEHGDERAEACA